MEQKKSAITLATKITIFRFLAVPVFVLFLIYYTESLARGEPNEYFRVWALVIFLIAALTDALDGSVARSRNEITRLGTILDPLADKAVLVSALVLLTRPSLATLQPQFPVGYTLVVISREVFLIAGAFVIDHYAGHVHIEPHLLGKVTTFFQMLAITWALASGPQTPFRIVVWIAGIFTVISGIVYLIEGIRQVETAEHHK
ncbi:MAG: CDP-alcohol phosphatidyltransferase family protein [Kiritimatiellae bacterium]|nr:CDP-alcohol phosphatidyltransferase family protein [Kiritimatiellia bacterium]